MSTIQLEIITPEKIAYNEPVDMVIAPSASGIIGILPHHVPLFSRLIEGELVVKKGKDESYYAIGGGFIQVTPEKITILVTSAYNSEEINEQEVLAAKKRAEQALATKIEGDELMAAQAAFRRSAISLKVLNRRRGSRSHSPSVS